MPVKTSENGEGWFSRVLRALFGWKQGSIRADLKDVLDLMPPGESGFSPEESRMLKNILGLRERRVGDVMIPRADIVALEISTPLRDVAAQFIDSEHSRLPVYRETLDDPVGFVHIKDVFKLIAGKVGRRSA